MGQRATREAAIPPRDPRVWNDRIFPLLRAALRARYFSLSVEGAAGVPREGPVVYVGNHAGWFALDALIFALAVHDHVAPERVPFAVVQDVLLRAPGLRSFFGPLGVIPASRMRDPVSLPPGVDAFGVFPEGVEGICKPVWQAYRMRPWHTGFVRLAALRRARVVPTALLGGEECLPSGGALSFLKPLLGAALPIPLSPVPLPTRWKIIFGAPIELERGGPQAASELAFCRAAAERIRGVVQALLEEHAADRPARRLSAWARRGTALWL